MTSVFSIGNFFGRFILCKLLAFAYRQSRKVSVDKDDSGSKLINSFLPPSLWPLFRTNSFSATKPAATLDTSPIANEVELVVRTTDDRISIPFWQMEVFKVSEAGLWSSAFVSVSDFQRTRVWKVPDPSSLAAGSTSASCKWRSASCRDRASAHNRKS